MLRFKIFYADGSARTDADGSPFDAPALHVVCILQENIEHGRRLIAFKDFYVWTGTEWWAVDEYGRFQYDVKPGPKRTLYGDNVDDATFNALMARAQADDYVPRQTARHPLDETA